MTVPVSSRQPAMGLIVWLQLLLLGAIWGGSFFFARIAVQEIPPLNLVLFRVLIAAAALQMFLAATRTSFRPALAQWPSFLLLALVNNVIPFSLMFLGQTEIGAGAASVINATTPFWTILVAALLVPDERPTTNKIAGVVIGIAGTAMMIGPGVVAGLGGPAWAKAALLGMAVSYAFAFVVARRITGLPPTVVATGQLTASSIVMIPVVLAVSGGSGLFDAGAQAWMAVFGLSLLATAFAYILYFRIIASAGATNASLVTLIVPVSAILLGAAFLGERLEVFELAGMAVIAVGLLVIDGRLLGLGGRRAAPQHGGIENDAAGEKTQAADKPSLASKING